MTDNTRYYSYNSYDDIEVWYGDRDKGKFIIGTRSEKEADKVVDELNTLLSENISLKKENIELKEILKHTYEIHECETCKHNQYFNWLDSATMEREYDSRCGKGLHYGDEVHGCEEYELDLEMFKKRVKR